MPPPFQAGLMATRLCFVALVIPSAFFLHPQLLLAQVDFDAALFLEAVGTLALSVWFLTTAMMGWSGRNLPMGNRALRTVARMLVLGTEPWIWIPAALAILALGLKDRRLSRRVATA